MASSTSLALRRLLLSSAVVPRTFRPAAVSSRLLNTNAARSHDSGDEGFYTKDHRCNRTDPFDPFTSRMRLSFRDQVVAKEKDDALHLWIDMPGLSREDVKVALEQNTVLVIRGEGGGDQEEEVGRKFSIRRILPEDVYKTDEIKAEMKNGVLKVVVPKLKEDERSNVRHIQVD